MRRKEERMGEVPWGGIEDGVEMLYPMPPGLFRWALSKGRHLKLPS